MQAWRIHIDWLNFWQSLDTKDDMAGGLQLGCSDADLLADEPIYQGGFANVGTT